MNKELMITLWNHCNNKCTFCYNQDFYHFPIDINKHLDNCIALLKSDKIKEFNCIRLIGGELFDNAIDSLNVRKQFNKILDTLQGLLETKQIQTVNIVTNLLYTDKKDLCYTLDFFKDNITLSTSYDLVGRFKSKIEEERWWNNIQFLQKEYPNLLVDVGINITQPLITQINKEWLDNFQAKLNKYTINFNELFTGIANKDKQTCGFSTLFPKRADFLVFIQNLIDWGYLDTIKDNKNIPLIHYVFDSQTGEAKMIDTNNIQEDGYIDSNIKNA